MTYRRSRGRSQLEYTKGWVEQRVRGGLARGESAEAIAADVGHAIEHAIDELRVLLERGEACNTPST